MIRVRAVVAQNSKGVMAVRSALVDLPYESGFLKKLEALFSSMGDKRYSRVLNGVLRHIIRDYEAALDAS